MVEKRTVTIQQASELTGISATALRRRVERGSLPSTLKDGRRHIPLAELDQRGLLLEAPGPPEDRAARIIDRLAEILREAEGLLAELRLEAPRNGRRRP